jgi:alpha-galactosidase
MKMQNMSPCLKKFRYLLGALSLAALSAGTATAETIPAELPPVDLAAPVAKDKPVKVYILSGQSNMLGFGRVKGATPLYSRIFLSADPNAQDTVLPISSQAMMRMGVYQSAAADAPAGALAQIYRGESPTGQAAKTEAFLLGSTEVTIPAIEGPHVVVAEAFIESPLGGVFEIHPGFESSSHCVATVDGKEVYRKTGSGEATLTTVVLKKNQRYPLQITYKQGGSAALWMEKLDLQGMGDLEWVVNDLGKFTSLLDSEGNWAKRPDVQLNDAYMGKGRTAPLSVNAVGKSFGPELGFGWVMGQFHEEPVIVMKADIGNRSLGWDILPPNTEAWEYEGKAYPGYGQRVDESGKPVDANGQGWYAGKQYDDYTTSIRAVLDNFDEKYPQYADQGFEVAGFVWWQGHKDGPNPGHNARYEENLANLIKAWRKEFDAPDAPWAIATVGFDGENMPEHYLRIAQAQQAVADPNQHPELAGTVKTVDARPFWRPAGISPKNQGFHYNHNAETYMLVGDALGRAMVELKGGSAEYPSGAIDPSIDLIPDLGWRVNARTIEAMQSALKPVLLDEAIPAYAKNAHEVPTHLRNAMPLSAILSNERPESKRREHVLTQLDKMISYYEMAGVDDYSWKHLPATPIDAEWQYFSFDPEKEPENQKFKIRYREVAMPSGMEDWYTVGFDAAEAGWATGKAPFGQNNGALEPIRKHCDADYCQCDMMPNTKWENEVLLMRTTMKVPEFDPGQRYRMVVGGAGHGWSGEGYALYIEGKLVSEMTLGFYKNGGPPRGVFLFNDLQQEMAGKEVTVALKGFLRMSGHKSSEAPPRGHLSAWVQSAKLPPLLQKQAAENSGESLR